MNKHYVRLDENNFIIKGFSDAFEQPLETDICINENGGRHFTMFDEINPSLQTIDGFQKYKYVNGEILNTDNEYSLFAEMQRIEALLMPTQNEIDKATREIETIELLTLLEVI